MNYTIDGSNNWIDMFDEYTMTLFGDFNIHRNYFKAGTTTFTYSTIRHESKPTLPLIYETVPVAKGITAFFEWEVEGKMSIRLKLNQALNYSLIHFNAEEMYETYFNLCNNHELKLAKFNSIIESPQQVDYVILNFLVDKEEQNLIASEKYYEEFLNESDENNKVKLKTYVKGYIRWIKEKLARLKIAHPELEVYTPIVQAKEPKKLEIKEPQTLHSIWKGTEEQYNTVINKLKNKIVILDDHVFVEETKEGLNWIHISKTGKNKYLRGFIIVCLQKNLIKKQESSTDYINILSNTFNIHNLLDDAFKSITKTNDIDDKYLAPFKNFPPNN